MVITCPAGCKTAEEIMSVDYEELKVSCSNCNNFTYDNGIGGCKYTLQGIYNNKKEDKES